MPSTRGLVVPALLVALLAAGGCATVFSGSDQSVSFSSNPLGAEVLVDGVPVGFTPVATRFDRDTFATRLITIRRPGYQPRQFQLHKSLNAIAILNLTCVLSWLTDAVTGGLIEYSPGAYHLELTPVIFPGPAGPGGWADTSPGADREALRFVLVNDGRIRTDIVRGGGEHLRALAHLWGIDGELPRATIALGQEAPVLLAREYPFELYLEIRRVLSDQRIL